MCDENMIIHLIAGGLAGTAGAVLTCPLEVVKTRFQASIAAGSSHLNTSHGLIRSTSSALMGLSEKANSSALTNTCKNRSLNYIYRNHHLNGVLKTTSTANVLNFEPHLATSHSQLLNKTASHIVHQHQQLQQSTVRIGNKILYQLKHIIQNEGYRALFKGLGPNIIGVAPYRAIYFFSYANSKLYLSKLIGEERPLLHICSAFIAGFSAVTITNPIWFIKTRLQVDSSRRGLTAVEVIKKILREKGPLGFYKGISASYFGISESAMYFVIYEKLKQISTKQNKDCANLTILTYFTSAGFSKTLASCLFYPHEVARTRLRLEGNKYTGFFQTLRLVVHEEGVKGIYKGMGTHLLRQIPNTAIVMTTYELLTNYFFVQNKNDKLSVALDDDED